MAKYARYNNLLGRGNRTASITVSTTLTLGGGTINNLVDGAFGNNFTDSIEVSSGQTGKEIKFVFGTAKKITGFSRFYSNSADTSQWKLAGSNDDVTYLDITGSVGPTSGIASADSTGTNDDFYTYYKLIQTSGTTSNSPYYREVEFRIVDSGTGDDQAAITPSYANFLGSGDRRGYIKIGGTTTFTSPLAIIDGSSADSGFFSGGQSGSYIEFDFFTECLITELTWTQSNSTSHNTWKWQKFSGGSWVDVGSSFTLGGSTSQVITAMSGETSYHTKYRLQQVSGTNSNSPFIREVTFKIGYPAIASEAITGIVPTTGSELGGTPVTISGTGFTSATGVTFDGVSATSFVLVNDTTITCVTPAGTLGLADIIVERTGTDLELLAAYEYIEFVPSSIVSQVPLLVIELSNQPVRATQIPLLVINLPIQGAKITQTPVLSVYTPKPVPLPLPIVPEVPLIETWLWQTVVFKSEKGKEQRAKLRSNPRVRLSFNALLMDDLDRQAAYSLILKYTSNPFFYPLYQYHTKLDAAAEIGDTKLFCNPAMTDIRAGETVALFNPALDKTYLLPVASIDLDGVVLASPLAFDVPEFWRLSPAIEFRMQSPSGLNMGAITGEFSLDFESLVNRNPARPTGDVITLTMLNGMLLLDAMPLADNALDESFDQNIEWQDIGSNRPAIRYNYFMPYISGSRSWKINDRLGALDYWREVASYLQGQQKPFLLPTFRNDFPLVETPAPGATTFNSTAIDFFNYWRSPTHRFIRWQSGVNVGYSLIQDVILNYDVSGNPVSITVKLAAAITHTENLVISFVNTCRLSDDAITIEHGAHTSKLNLKFTTVDA